MDALGRQFLATGAESIQQGDPVLLVVRPEDITGLTTGASGPEANTVVGRIAVRTFAGTSTHFEVMVAGRRSRWPRMGPVGSISLEAWVRRCVCS
jgi:hypothetical protein